LEKKKILIPGGNYSDWALITAAQRLGLYVISSGTKREGPAHEFADEYVYADYSDKEAMLALAKEKKIDYMCSNANDFGLLSTAYVCEQLGLPGHDSYETTLTLHSKDRFKPIAKKLGLHSPISEIFDNREEAIDFIRGSDKKMIIKPADNVGSYGVSVPQTVAEIPEKVDFAFSKSKKGKIVVEPFIEGFFVPATAMLINQEVVTFLTDGYFEYPQGIRKGPEFPKNMRSTGFTIPSPYEEEFAPAIIEDFNKIAKELNLVDGKFHCELMVTPEHEAYIFDVHRRMSGAWEPWSHWDMSEEINWEEWIVRAECGMDLSGFPRGFKYKRHIHTRNIYAPRNGLLKRVIFDEYLTSHMFPKFEGKNYVMHNMFVTDHLHQPIFERYFPTGGPLIQFAFDNAEEAERITNPENDEFYSHITFEYADCYC